MTTPCSADPDRWATDHDDPAARLICATKCPLRRDCARRCLAYVNHRGGAVEGIWAGVYLPPGPSRPRYHAIERLRSIAEHAPVPEEVA